MNKKVWTKGIEAKQWTMCGWTWVMETTSTKSRRRTMASWLYGRGRTRIYKGDEDGVDQVKEEG